jgi:hypothetical protein
MFVFFVAVGQQNLNIITVENIALNAQTNNLKDGLEKLDDFSIGKDKIYIWGGGIGIQNRNVYPAEVLPVFFLRTLQFENMQLENDAFEWIFTGSKGGITIKVSNNEILLLQRYYDSFGFNEVDLKKNTIKADRYPQNQIIETKTKFTGKLSTLSLESNSNLMITLRANNQLIAQLPCLFDLTRHQLKYTGKGQVEGVMFKPLKGQKVTIKVNPGKTYQKILGFGGILSPSAYWSLNMSGKEKWWSLIKEYNLLLQREYPTSSILKPDFSNWDEPACLVPHYYGDNFPNGELTDFEYVRKIRSLGGIDIFEFWGLPEFMYENGKLKIVKYAEAIINFCKTSVAKTGKAPEIVGIQNEVTQTPETWRDMTISLRQQLDANGFKNVKIHAHNSSSLKGGINAMKGFQKYPGIWDMLDYTASNLYDYQDYIFSPDEYDKRINEFNSLVGNKPFISTEICVNAGFLQTDAYKLAFSYAMLYHKNMAMLNASSIMYCWTLLDYTQPSFAATRTLFTLDHSNDMQPVASGFQLRTFGAFSRHIIKGMNRVDISSESTPLLVTAYSGKKSNTLVALNPTTRPIELDIQWNKVKFKGMERTSCYLNNQQSKVPHTIVIEPGEIITLY